MIIERLIKDNIRLYENLEILRIVSLKKITESEKIHSLFIVEIAIKVIMNQLINMSMLNSYQECKCKLFEKNCYIMQCFKCFKFNHMIKFCKKDQCCVKCASKHHIEKCMISLNKRCCINCNDSHKLWRRICVKWQQQMKQSSEIYKNRLFRYFEVFKYTYALILQLLNSSDSVNSADSMNSLNSINLSSSAIVMLKTRSQVTDESAWQVVKVKKRWVDLFFCVSSDSKEMTTEQNYECSTRK